MLKRSDDELNEVAAVGEIPVKADPGAALRALLGRFQFELVAMTRGPRGAPLVSASESIDQPGIPGEVRAAVGAGDALTAALVMGWLKGEPLATIAHGACTRAAAVCAQAGAVPNESWRRRDGHTRFPLQPKSI